MELDPAARPGPSVLAVPTVLVIEDDELIASSLQRALVATGYTAPIVNSIAAAEQVLTDGLPDLILCDLGLPDGDGLDLIARLGRSHPRLPILVLTARDEEADLVAGLSAGAVDYVTKPFRLAELLARIAAHLRTVQTAPARATADDVITIGDLTIDLGARRVHVAGAEADLRPKEFDLLARLAAHAGRVVRREDLMTDVWDEHWWGSTKTLDVHLNALRRHLGEEPGGTSRITAIRGVGYRLEAG